jgi:hypothetical protein
MFNQALAVDMSWQFDDAWDDYWANKYTLVIRSDVTDEYAAEDLDALRQAGLDENDIYDITHPQSGPENQNGSQQPGSAVGSGQWAVSNGLPEKTQPSTPEGNKKPAPPVTAVTSPPQTEGTSEDSIIIIPAFPDEATRVDYELTYYLNDLCMQNVQVAMEFGKRDEVKNVYTYGSQRLDAERVDGSVDVYLYDGRGSVAQVFDGVEIAQNLWYDAYGEVTSGANENDINSILHSVAKTHLKPQ